MAWQIKKHNQTGNVVKCADHLLLQAQTASNIDGLPEKNTMQTSPRTQAETTAIVTQ